MRTGIDCKGREWEEIPLGCAFDLTFLKFEYLNPICRIKSKDIQNHDKALWVCKCRCGNDFIALGTEIKNKHTTSCGCRKGTILGQTRHKLHDKTGKRFGKLVALKVFKIDDKHRTWYQCQCDCGKVIEVVTMNLHENDDGGTRSCGCSYLESGKRNSGYKDLSGQKFNSLLVIERVPSPRKDKKAYYKCLCDCGKETIVQGCELKNGHTRTCGCGTGLSLGEEKIKQILEEYQIKYLYNKPFFKDLITSGGGYGRYDFILIDSNDKPYRIIEFDGAQHYIPTSFYYKINPLKNLEYTQMNDNIKTQYALEHNIPLVRIPYTQLNHINYNMIMGDTFLIRKESYND